MREITAIGIGRSNPLVIYVVTVVRELRGQSVL